MDQNCMVKGKYPQMFFDRLTLCAKKATFKTR